jgi:N utilization substance protein B
MAKRIKLLSSYQKLKQKISEQEKEYKNLKNDFRRYAKGDFMVKAHYDSMFKFEDDLEFVKYVLKNFLLKHESMTEYFEEKDLNWSLNKDVVKSMANKTFKIEALEDLSLQPLAIQWEDDKLFFEELFDYSVSEDKKLSAWIGDQTKNWESDRLAVADFIILKMALAEMVNFSSIPVKVSINEYIELAKNYSTPKSGQFINGILDVVSNRLVHEKVINKSGRGLIDIANK